jgi:molybdate transport system substrate-binding protein
MISNRSAVAFLLLLSATAGCFENNIENNRPCRIYAAASLTTVLPDIVTAFHPSFPDIEFEYNFAASSILAKQILQGGKADIYLSANQQWMDHLEQQDKLAPTTRIDFLGNTLVLITPVDRPLNLKDWHDLTKEDIRRVALADWSHVPAGIYARNALQKLGIWQLLREKCLPALDVRAALAYVERGDADCGIVYKSDTLITARVRIEKVLPEEVQPAIIYSAAVISISNHPVAGDFVTFLQSATAKRIFIKHGFTTKDN